MREFEHHLEISKAKVRSALTEVAAVLDDLVGWMNAAGYSDDAMKRAITARGEIRALFNTLVVVNEESETPPYWRKAQL